MMASFGAGPCASAIMVLGARWCGVTTTLMAGVCKAALTGKRKPLAEFARASTMAALRIIVKVATQITPTSGWTYSAETSNERDGTC